MLFYRIISILLYPFIEIYLFYRLYKKKEDKHRLKERFGQPTFARPNGDIIWLNAVSVGEANSAMILVEELLRASSSASILITTTTLTSAAIVNEKLSNFKGRVLHQFLPIDSYYCVVDFFDFWQIKTAIFVESEIWPNLVYEAHKRNIPSFLINARISKKSLKRWQLAKKLGFDIFNYFKAIFVQMEEDLENFKTLSNGEILFYGNLKSEAQILKVDDEELIKLQLQIARRPIFLAVSTHNGEEEIIIETHKKLKLDFPNLLTIIAPRHPNRTQEISLLLNGINFSQRSKKEAINNSTEIYIANTLGELGIFYSLANFAFIGGSFGGVGGHNPFEAIHFECSVISGDKVANFQEIYRQLNNNKGCVIINNKEQLLLVVKKFLSNKDFCQDFAKNAKEIIANQLKNNNISKRIIDKINSL